MTERYSHYAPENFNDAFQKIDSIYGNSAGQENTAANQTESNSSDRVPNFEKVQPEAQKQKETVQKANHSPETVVGQPKTDNVIKFDFVNRKLAWCLKRAFPRYFEDGPFFIVWIFFLTSKLHDNIGYVK